MYADSIFWIQIKAGITSVLIWIKTIWHLTLIKLFEKVDFEKSQQMTTQAWKITEHAKS